MENWFKINHKTARMTFKTFSSLCSPRTMQHAVGIKLHNFGLLTFIYLYSVYIYIYIYIHISKKVFSKISDLQLYWKCLPAILAKFLRTAFVINYRTPLVALSVWLLYWFCYQAVRWVCWLKWGRYLVLISFDILGYVKLVLS